jgi:hypothetical protein
MLCRITCACHFLPALLGAVTKRSEVTDTPALGPVPLRSHVVTILPLKRIFALFCEYSASHQGMAEIEVDLTITMDFRMNLDAPTFDGLARTKHEELVKDFFRTKGRASARPRANTLTPPRSPDAQNQQSTTARQRRFERRHAVGSLQN